MLDRLKDLFTNAEPSHRGEDKLRLAVAALLAEAARLDGDIQPRERDAIQRVLARRFNLAPDEAIALARKGEATAEEATQIFGFTQVINHDWPIAERAELFEMMYEVMYADETLQDSEASLMRRLGALVYLPDKERGEARQRVLRRLGRTD